MEKFKFTPEFIRAKNDEFKKSEEWKDFVVPLIKSLGKK